MKGLVIFFLIFVGLSLFGFMAVISSTNNDDIKQDSKSIQFRTFTSAVCETENNLNYCRDELFVNCSGKVSKAEDTKECNGFKVDSKVTGFAVFEKK